MDDFIHDLPGVDTVKGIYYDAKKEWKQLKRAVLQQLSGNETFRQTAAWKDEIMAHLRWSTRILQPNMIIPQPVEWDSRHIVALMELGRVLNDHARSHDGSSFHLPPVTSATCLLLLLVFFKPGGVLLQDVSLSPYCVLSKKEYYRLVSAALVHVDATHLITNLTAALPECVALEEQQGSAGLAADLVLLTLTSHALYVGFAWLQKSVFVRRYNYYSLVTVGFSGVVFGLKVWNGFKRGGLVYVWGVPIPSRFSWVPTLALTHLCVPEASFPAHMAGVVAGLLRAYCWEPVLYCIQQSWQCCRKGRGRRSSSSSGGSSKLASLGDTTGHMLLPDARQQQLLGSTTTSRISSNNGSIQKQQQLDQSDWRLQLHLRWLQQAESSSGEAVAQSQQSLVGAEADQPGGEQRPLVRSRSRRWGGQKASTALLDVSLQLALVAAAAGLYFALSSGERSSPPSSRLRSTSFWRR